MFKSRPRYQYLGSQITAMNEVVDERCKSSRLHQLSWSYSGITLACQARDEGPIPSQDSRGYEMICRQCVMERKVGNKKIILTSWIPEKFAIKNKVIKLHKRVD